MIYHAVTHKIYYDDPAQGGDDSHIEVTSDVDVDGHIAIIFWEGDKSDSEILVRTDMIPDLIAALSGVENNMI